ncbi:hypothetical protein RJT34_06678 [Clitoria ternatea]|uniref:Uncharacterized protein n=1 Tax=Clitoria ternatea TaxID=43366 RepID=A0AAN9PTN8_CLITE
MRETKPNLDSSSPCLGHKRSAELDSFTKKKSPRIEDKEEEVLVSEQGNKNREFSRHLNFNNLDLNMKADEEEEDDGKIKKGENRFELNERLEREREMGEMLL